MTGLVEDLYERDFYAWAHDQAAALRRLADARANVGLDIPNLVEEVEGLARSERNAVVRQLERLIEHLLKLEHSPAAWPRRGWLTSIRGARAETLRHLTAAIRQEVEPDLQAVYEDGRYAAVQGLLDHGEVAPAGDLPDLCPYTLDQLLDRGWFPANRHGLVDDPQP